jgi:hypothetical protein
MCRAELVDYRCGPLGAPRISETHLKRMEWDAGAGCQSELVDQDLIPVELVVADEHEWRVGSSIYDDCWRTLFPGTNGTFRRPVRPGRRSQAEH